MHEKRDDVQLNRQIKVGLVQIGDKFGNQYYLPYSIGLLQAYAQKKLKNPEEFIFLLPIYKKIKINEAIDNILEADIIFFSTYIWNYKMSLEIAKDIKQRKDSCIIVFGGPQVPESADDMKTFLRNYPFIDIGCYGEGEIPFLSILDNAKERSWENVPSIGFTAGTNNSMYNPISERIKNLNEIPSPYLEGIFDSLIEANPQEEWSALIETNRGCPHTCAFCYWGKKTRN
ncbi:cobalamin-dependent protein, partial [Patescibacteria group bacterium]|nr:cobalamin-dependent protein [Patescibacteria group bacterium]